MTKEQIKEAYRVHLCISFQFAVECLMRIGFTYFAAEQYLYAE